jgi:hypothetical protein
VIGTGQKSEGRARNRAKLGGMRQGRSEGVGPLLFEFYSVSPNPTADGAGGSHRRAGPCMALRWPASGCPISNQFFSHGKLYAGGPPIRESYDSVICRDDEHYDRIGCYLSIETSLAAPPLDFHEHPVYRDRFLSRLQTERPLPAIGRPWPAQLPGWRAHWRIPG